jgi:cytochrome b pre-mRNA-processing protein 3
MLNLLRKSAERKQAARGLYDQLITRARNPVFFLDFGVPDTVDGRFDLLALHAWMTLARLKAAGQDELAQELTNIVFVGFDEALREQGAGDIGIGHRIKALANAFYGRLAAYEAAKGEEAMAAALARNIWRGSDVGPEARKLASYVSRARQHLESSGVEHGLDFGVLPSI